MAHKYGAKAVVIDNIRFASQKEGRRYGELKLLEKAGKISNLQLQPRYDLHARNCGPSAGSGEKVGEYRADFAYLEGKDWGRGRWVVEDVKGFKTPLYKWKRKHVFAQYGISITEV